HTRSKRDWSSDVCSSDLASILLVPGAAVVHGHHNDLLHLPFSREPFSRFVQIPTAPAETAIGPGRTENILAVLEIQDRITTLREIGRASCRERVEIWVEE